MFFKVEFDKSPENVNYILQEYFNASKKIKYGYAVDWHSP